MYNHDYNSKPLDTKFHGFYRGHVLDVLDPLQSGRVKVKVFSVYDNVPEEIIPWAEYADPMMTMGFFVPDVGDLLWVFFDNGDHMKPVYFAGAASGKYGPPEKRESPTQYPKNRIFKTDAGHLIEVDDTPGYNRINIEHSSGTRLTMFPDGSAELLVKKNYYLNVNGDYITRVGGDHHEIVEGHTTFIADRIDLNP